MRDHLRPRRPRRPHLSVLRRHHLAASVLAALVLVVTSACVSGTGGSHRPSASGHGSTAALKPPPAVVTSPAAIAASSPPAAASAVSTWLAQPTVYIAHRGGDTDWPEASATAYADALAWNPQLALETPVRRTSDGVWVLGEDATTGRMYGTDLVIAQSTWAQLSTLRTIKDGLPMARLQQDVLDVAPRDRILFVDDKDDIQVDALLDLLDQYGGHDRTIMKSFWSNAQPLLAHARGYLTWGYYYADDLSGFASSESRFDLLGLDWDAPASAWSTVLATNKRVIGHVVSTEEQGRTALAAGATGLMVSGVEQVVPHA